MVFKFRGAMATFTPPIHGHYRFTAVGAKAADGTQKRGGRGGKFAELRSIQTVFFKKLVSSSAGIGDL